MAGDRFIQLALSEDRHVFDVLFRHASESITVQDRSGCVIYANPMALELLGMAGDLVYDQEATLVERFEFIDESGAPLGPFDLPGRRVLESGAAVSDTVVGYRRKGDEHDVRWSRVRASPVKDDSGQVVWAINFFLDITEDIRRSQSEQLLVALHEAVAPARNVESVAAAVVDVLVPRVANWGGIHLLQDSGHLDAIAMRYPDSAAAQQLFVLIPQDHVTSEAQMQARVVTSGNSEYVTITEELLMFVQAEMGPAVVDLLRELDVASVACLPLRAADRPIGTLTLARSGSAMPFDAADAALLSTIAERSGLALANAVLSAHEHELAEAVTKGLQPDLIPAVPGVTLSIRYRPQAQISRVGGDFYDVIPLSPERCVMFVGDIEGKGTSAAGSVASAKQTLRTAIALDSHAAVALGQLNRTALDQKPARMCTLAYVVLQREQDGVVVEVSLAGHPPPFILHSDGSVVPIGNASPPAGVMPLIEPTTERALLGPGDVFFAYTDGILARNSSVHTLRERLCQLKSASTDDLLDRLLAHAEQDGIRDDIVLLAFRVE